MQNTRHCTIRPESWFGLDETTWVKTGIEFVNGVHNVSAVVTRDFSDWSVVPLGSYPGSLRLRLKREGGAVILEYGAAARAMDHVPNGLFVDCAGARSWTDGGCAGRAWL